MASTSQANNLRSKPAFHSNPPETKPLAQAASHFQFQLASSISFDRCMKISSIELCTNLGTPLRLSGSCSKLQTLQSWSRLPAPRPNFGSQISQVTLHWDPIDQCLYPYPRSLLRDTESDTSRCASPTPTASASERRMLISKFSPRSFFIFSTALKAWRVAKWSPRQGQQASRLVPPACLRVGKLSVELRD